MDIYVKNINLRTDMYKLFEDIVSARLMAAFECEDIEFALFKDIKSMIEVKKHFLITVKYRASREIVYYILLFDNKPVRRDINYDFCCYDEHQNLISLYSLPSASFDIFINKAFKLIRRKFKLTLPIKIRDTNITDWYMPFVCALTDDAIYERAVDDKLKDVIWDAVKYMRDDLNFSWLSLDSFPKEIYMLNKVTGLDLSNNNIGTIPERIDQLTNLQYLLLNNNSIEHLPTEITGLKNLRKLVLSDNILFELPEGIGNLKLLEHLEIRDVLLNKLPEEVGKLTKLIILDLKAKFIDSICESIGKLKNLKKLVIEGTSIQKLPESIGNLKSLEELHIIDNKLLEKLPDSVGRLTNLKYLYVYGNKIASLPESVNKLKNIKKIYFK